jgi:hypothetical protein
MKHFGHCVEPERGKYEMRIVNRAVPHFVCRCRRLVPQDMMLDLAPSGTLPDELSALSGGDRYRCDGCWRGWLLRGTIAVARLRELTEQPAAAEGAQW